jgi:hypothetical protein
LPKIQVSCYSIDCTDVKKKIKKLFTEIENALTEVIARRASETVQEIEAKFLDI